MAHNRFGSIDESSPAPGWSPALDPDSDCADNGTDAHAEYINTVRAFRRTLLQQFERDTDVRDPLSAGFGSEPYMARFAQPYPAVPIWACDEVGSTAEGGSLRDYSCAPLVCVVMKDSADFRAAVRNGLCRLASHSVGLLVTVHLLVPSEGEEAQQLLFVTIGLRAPTELVKARNRESDPDSPTSAPNRSMLKGIFQDDVFCSNAVQRQMVWAAAHDTLRVNGQMPAFVDDIYMLQDVWLYSRLFNWIRNQGGGTGPFRPMSQVELDLLVSEYGEETATHFLFARHYTLCLRWVAAAAGTCIIVSQLAAHGFLGDSVVIEFWKRSFLLVFLPGWAFMFQASWQAVSQKQGFRWLGSLGAVQNSIKEVARLQAMEDTRSKFYRYVRLTVSTVPLMSIQMILVSLITTTLIMFEVWMYDVAWETFTPFGRALVFSIYNLALGVAFTLQLAVFYPISKFLTRWEKHPDRDTENWHSTAKVYGNWFFAIFLYFFVIAFCYIPFGDNIADVAAMLLDSTHGHLKEHIEDHGGNSSAHHEAARMLAEAGKEHRYSVRGALQSFHPDTKRLAVDVMLFFVIQDVARLCQIFFPIIRAALGLGKLLGAESGKRHRHKRTAIFCNAWCGRRFCGRSDAVDEVDLDSEMTTELVPNSNRDFERGLSENSRKNNAEKRPSALGSVVASRIGSKLRVGPKQITSAPDEAMVLYCFFQTVETSYSVAQETEAEVVVMTCGVTPSAGTCSSGVSDEAPVVMSRLRPCYPRDGRSDVLSEDPEDLLGDLVTLGIEPNMMEAVRSPRDGECATVRLMIGAEILGKSSDNAPLISGANIDALSTWGCIVEVPVAKNSMEAAGTSRTVRIGPVTVQCVVGIVSAATRAEAMEKVPRHLRCSIKGNSGPSSAMSLEESQKEERSALKADAGVLPWVWWDEELTARYRDEVFELYAVQETFETFEIYAHLATSLSYVCLFGMAAPLCPVLAWIFVSIELRQDQLRLLLLSRPPHPEEETMRFKRKVSLGAWYEIMEFTCHMSVMVNLLLWGLTYTGLGDTMEWSMAEWWRNIAMMLVFQQVGFAIAGVLHRTIAQLDHETASAYLRRYARLQKAFRREYEAPAGNSSTKELTQTSSRRRLTRQKSGGLSSLV